MLLLLGLGGTELIILIIVFIALPIMNSVLFYRLGKKAGYNQGKAEALDKKTGSSLTP